MMRSNAATVLVAAVGDRVGLTGRTGAVPGSGEAVTAAWLSGVLCKDVPGARVTAIDITGGSDGTSSRRAIRVTYNDAGTAAGLPERVFTKTSTSLATRMLLGMTGITAGESIFFNELRPLVELRSPKAYFAASDPKTCRSIAVLDDLSQDGWTFPDPMTNRVDERDAADMVEQLAALHASFWNRRQAAGAVGQLQSALAVQQRLNRIALFERRVRTGLERARASVPARLWARRDELFPALMHALARPGPETVLHHDVHLGNWLRDADGRMGLYDWQVIVRGHWASDVSYALIVGLEPADRRAWERYLIAHYVGALADHGLTDLPSVDAAFDDYRRHPMHAYGFGVFTNGQPRYLPELQPADYTLRSIERICIALDDLDTLGALRT